MRKIDQTTLYGEFSALQLALHPMDGSQAPTFESVPPEVSGMFLSVMPAVSLDTETTGLDVAKDRVVEMAAVRIAPADTEREREFQTFVAPGIPIPAASRLVHGIADEDVAGAPQFAEAMCSLAEWVGPSVVIGFAIGFDLAVLKAEHERHGLQWNPPRSLDVRHLLEVLSPPLGGLSLEAAAARFSIPVENRHRALPDAQLAAAVFMHIVPLLRERGIRTLAQAQRAIAQGPGNTRYDPHRPAEYSAPASPQSQPVSLAEYARIDSFAFRHRVGDLMSSPPVEIGGEVSVRDAIRKMSEAGVGSLFVQGLNGKSSGILTERDVFRALVRDDSAALDASVDPIASRPLVTVADSEFVYRALALMSSHGFRHLGVVDDDGTLIGALSVRDLLRQRAGDAVALGSSIESAASAEELGRIWLNLPKVARALDLEDVDARDTAAVISRELRAMTRRACEIAQAELEADGAGPPPANYALFVLGSGGRGESLLAMDQDNAIVYQGSQDDQATDAWFERLGRRIAEILDGAGVAYCKGGVMASNAAWRMSVARWKETTRSWISRTRPDDILACDIFFDAVAVRGDTHLFDEIWSHAAALAGQSRPFLNLLALKTNSVPSAFGWFGRTKLDHGRIDLKRYGLLPIFSAARVVALAQGISARSTRDRLTSAAQLDVVPETAIDDLLACHRIFVELILRQQLRDLLAGIQLSNTVAPAELTTYESQQLSWALHRVPRITDLLGTPAS